MKKITLGLSLAALTISGAAYADHHGKGSPMKKGSDTVVTRAEAQAQATQRFARMDVNQDGKLDAADREARRIANRTRMFDTLDADKNGQISREEFMAHERAGRRGGDAGEGKRGYKGKRGHGGKMMQSADTNGDGAISQSEFVAAALQRFDAMDANKDGQVKPEERKAAWEAMRGKWRNKAGAATGS